MFSSKKILFNNYNSDKLKTWKNIDKVYGNPSEGLGQSVSISSDGRCFVVGKQQQNLSVAKVYQLNENNILEQKGTDIEIDETHSGVSKVSISYDGNLILVGLPYYKNGCVKAYEWDGSNWLQKGSDINGESIGSGFGQSVCLSSDGQFFLVGQLAISNWTQSADGCIKAYEWSEGDWIQKGSTIFSGNSGDNLGFSNSVSSDGNVIVFGAPKSSSQFGDVYVYEWSISQSDWIQKGQKIKGETFDQGESGHSVSISSDGSILAIGAIVNDGKEYLNDPGLGNSGHVRVYKWDGASWVQKGQDIDGENGGDYSGFSVDLSSDGNIVAIGAIYNDGIGGVWSGHVRVYEWDGDSWIQKGQDIDGEIKVIHSGWSLSISSDGKKIAIGAIRDHLPDRIDSRGSVKLVSFE